MSETYPQASGFIQGTKKSPLPFSWEKWYATYGGRNSRSPEANHILEHIITRQYPRMEGVVNPMKQLFADPEEAAVSVHRKALQLGADDAGIAKIEPGDIYQNRTVCGPFAIIVLQQMNRNSFSTVPSVNSALECLMVYLTLGNVVIGLADYIRSLGYHAAVAHPLGDSDVLHIPLAIKAGLGEPGRHGSLIRRGSGPMFRLGGVLTDLPLRENEPVDTGQAAFCDTCKICRQHCPAGAIPDHRSPEAGTDPFGHPRYIVDASKCFPFFAKYHYCSVCLAVCPVRKSTNTI
jgi:ferredoxin